MNKLNSAIFCLLRGTNQQLLEPLTAASRTVGNIVGLRSLSTTAARLQEAETQTEVDVAPETLASRSERFSICPPFPGQDSALRWGGMKFEDLPIVHIKATYNNTHIQVTDNAGQSMARTSCGAEGFRSSKKSTPIASQTTGISAATKAQAKGVTFARVLIKGLGPGGLAAIKGLSMGGLQIVSITDNTPVPHNGCRPRKARRI